MTPEVAFGRLLVDHGNPARARLEIVGEDAALDRTDVRRAEIGWRYDVLVQHRDRRRRPHPDPEDARADPILRRAGLVTVVEDRRSIVRLRLLGLAHRDDADDLHPVACGILNG